MAATAGGGASGISAGGGGAGSSMVDPSVTDPLISATEYNLQFAHQLSGPGIVLTVS